MVPPRFFVLAALLALGCQPVEQVTLRVVTYNIRHGRGMDGEVDLERTAAVLRGLNPDIVALQEVDNGVARSGSQDQAAVLGELLGMHHAFGAFMDYQGGQYGMAILSRHPVASVLAVPLPEGNEPRVALSVEVRLPDGRSVRVVNVHFDWVASDSFRYAQAQALAGYLDTLTVPYLLVGDFNDQPGSRTIDLFRQRAVEARKPDGAAFTFPSVEPGREIDYLFAAPAEAWEVGPAVVVPEEVASDHRPVHATLRLLPAVRNP